MRSIWAAELEYKRSYGGFGCPLAVLDGHESEAPPSQQAAKLISVTLATGQRSGYTFNLVCRSTVTSTSQGIYDSFHLTGVPQAGRKSGEYGFCIDETSNLKYDPAGGTNCTQPVP
jgi:type IV pilus assembly protein PilA